MPGKRAAAALLAAIAVWCISCTAPPHQSAAVNHRISPSAPVRSATAAPVCFGAMPTDWTRALNARSVTSPAGTYFGPGGVADGAAIGQFNSAVSSGIGLLDMITGRLTTIARFPGPMGGMGAMAVDPPWVVWEELDSQNTNETNLNDWTIHVWNLSLGTGRLLATSRLSNGTYLTGQQPLPVVRNGVAAWAQPVPSQDRYDMAQVRAVDLLTGKTSVLDTGRVSSPVYAGPYLIWGKIDSAGHDLLRVADAADFKPVVTPGPLRSPGPLLYLAGSPQYLAWSSGDLNTLTVWPVGTNRLLRFTQSDSGHPFQFLQLAGHFVLWYTGNGSSVLDLRTGNAFDVVGSVAATADTIAVEEQIGQPPPKGSFASVRVSTLAVAAMPGFRGCAKNGMTSPS
jgi:hypothetical protein